MTKNKCAKGMYCRNVLYAISAYAFFAKKFYFNKNYS